MAQLDTKLHERVGSGTWSVVGTYAPSVSSKAFSGKAAGTYSYKTEQCFTGFGSTTCWDSEGPESVTVSAAPTPALTASISWNPSTVDYGGSSTLTWSSTNATSCTLDGAPRATRGSRVGTNRTRTQTSTLSCTGPGGTSETESATLTVNPTVPDAPAKPEVNPGDGRLEVSWTAPAANGSPLTRYGMHYKATSASSWTTHPLSSAGTSTNTTITTGLMNGTTYQLQVRAHNAVGASAFSATARGTPQAQPVPTASLSWDPETVDYGGSSTLTWSSTNATGCTLDGATRATRGSRVETNRTRNQTSRLYCTGPGGTSNTVSATLRVRSPALEITIVPSPSTDGNYTVSWGAPRCFGGGGFIPQICQVLQERTGRAGTWAAVSGVRLSATSHAFSGKPTGTYYYRLVLGGAGDSRASECCGVKSAASDGKHQLESLDGELRGVLDLELEFHECDGLPRWTGRRAPRAAVGWRPTGQETRRAPCPARDLGAPRTRCAPR